MDSMGVVCEACSRHGVILLMQLECEWIIVDGMSVVCEACSRHGAIDADKMRICNPTSIFLKEQFVLRRSSAALLFEHAGL